MTQQFQPELGSGALREALELMVKEWHWYAGKHGLGPARLQYALGVGERALSLSSPIEPGPDIKSLYCEKHQHVAEAAAAGFLSDDCPTCEIQRAEREAKCSNCGNIVLVPTPQAFSEIRELIKEWRAKADYESARWSNQGSSTAQERIDAVGDYYADALEKALAPSRQGAAKRVEG